jgi:hypothetical protein
MTPSHTTLQTEAGDTSKWSDNSARVTSAATARLHVVESVAERTNDSTAPIANSSSEHAPLVHRATAACREALECSVSAVTAAKSAIDLGKTVVTAGDDFATAFNGLAACDAAQRMASTHVE